MVILQGYYDVERKKGPVGAGRVALFFALLWLYAFHALHRAPTVEFFESVALRGALLFFRSFPRVFPVLSVDELRKNRRSLRSGAVKRSTDVPTERRSYHVQQ